MFLFQLFCFELRRASHYCTRSSHARVERVSSASRARASVNLWVDGTVVTAPFVEHEEDKPSNQAHQEEDLYNMVCWARAHMNRRVSTLAIIICTH